MNHSLLNVACVTYLTSNIQSAVEPVIAPTLVFLGQKKLVLGGRTLSLSTQCGEKWNKRSGL